MTSDGIESYKELKDLVLINLKTQWLNFYQQVQVIGKYYRKASYIKADTSLLLEYLWNNPFTISRRFLEKKNESDVHRYGETPLTTFDYIVKASGITNKDTFYELGCGRGRTCFWIHSFVGCKVIGIDYIPEFIARAQKIVNKYHLKNLEFKCNDITKENYNDATVIYLYGTCLEDHEIENLIQRLKSLPKGVKIITVSFALNEYDLSHSFEIIKCFPATFTWGQGDVYIQIKK